jgi:hypothetical protein
MIATAVLVALLAFAQGAEAPPRQDSDAGMRAGADDGGTDADGGMDADGGTARRSPEATPPELAKKAVDLANIHLQAARLYVVGLFHLSRKPTSSWDRAHSVSLFNAAENAITDADRSLAELSGMARGKWQKAAEPLAHARATLVQVQKELRSLSVPATGTGPADAQQVARKVHQGLDSAGKDLESAAKTMGVDTKIKGP